MKTMQELENQFFRLSEMNCRGAKKYYMNYRLKEVKGKECDGYKVFEDDKRYYSVDVRLNGSIDQTTWASLNRYGERDMHIFTREYCEYQGIGRETYDTVTILQ